MALGYLEDVEPVILEELSAVCGVLYRLAT